MLPYKQFFSNPVFASNKNECTTYCKRISVDLIFLVYKLCFSRHLLRDEKKWTARGM